MSSQISNFRPCVIWRQIVKKRPYACSCPACDATAIQNPRGWGAFGPIDGATPKRLLRIWLSSESDNWSPRGDYICIQELDTFTLKVSLTKLACGIVAARRMLELLDLVEKAEASDA